MNIQAIKNLYCPNSFLVSLVQLLLLVNVLIPQVLLIAFRIDWLLPAQDKCFILDVRGELLKLLFIFSITETYFFLEIILGYML